MDENFARCPKCGKSFRTLADEPPTECPRCGYNPYDYDDEGDE
jgi:predicted  nucleic acid-binding Zn-ribbon protein